MKSKNVRLSSVTLQVGEMIVKSHDKNALFLIKFLRDYKRDL